LQYNSLTTIRPLGGIHSSCLDFGNNEHSALLSHNDYRTDLRMGEVSTVIQKTNKFPLIGYNIDLVCRLLAEFNIIMI